jgi:hypothetical protein
VHPSAGRVVVGERVQVECRSSAGGVQACRMQVECRSSVGGGGGGGGGGGSRVQDTDMAKLPKWDSFMCAVTCMWM